ncbi:MAG: hypothetical protein GY909_09345 [Oligoflexia bacterium]|nr:hypothetical protein [Oligoflexia bacterium]
MLKVLLLACLLASSCGRERKPVDDTVDFNATVTAGGNALSDSELAVALRICYAYRSKKTEFRANKINSAFAFDVKYRACGDTLFRPTERLDTTLKQVFESSPMIYDVSTDLRYLNEVQTHMDGHLSEICDQVIKGETPLNVEEISLSEVKQFSFSSTLGDSYQISFAKRASTNVSDYDVYKIERYKVLTNSSVSGDLLGLVSEFERYEECSGSSEPQTLIQEFVP